VAANHQQGCFYWSWRDNYEHANGYEKHFEVIRVDIEAQNRAPKTGFQAFKNWLFTQPGLTQRQEFSFVAKSQVCNPSLCTLCSTIRLTPRKTCPKYSHGLAG